MMAGELEQIAVERVGARLGRGVDRRAGVKPVLRVLRAGLHAELLQRVRERQRQVEVVVRVVVKSRRRAGRRRRTPGRPPPNSRRRPMRPGCSGSTTTPVRTDGAGDLDQVRGVAAVERQLLDPFVLDDAADRGVARFDERRRRFDRTVSASSPSWQGHRDHRIAADLQHDARSGRRCGNPASATSRR